tara:strand:+ start:1227 stop:1484 length:258 start_codon:yes stop_codon:yes gene_type:complete
MDAEKRQTPTLAAEAVHPVHRAPNGKEPRPEQKRKMLRIYSKEPSNAYGVRQELANGGVVHKGKLSTKFVRRNHKQLSIDGITAA